MEWYMLVLTIGALSAVFSAFFAYVTLVVRDYRVAKLENQVESLIMRDNGERGNRSRAINSERQAEAMAKAALLLKEGKPTGEILKQVASEYPDVAIQLAKKFGIGL